MRHYFIVFITILGVFLTTLTAQSLTIIPIEADEQPFSMDELFQVTIVNPTTEGGEAIFDIRLEDKNGQLVLSATSAPMLWKKGATTFPAAARATMRFVYDKTSLSSTLRETGRLPFGNYTLCYRCLDAKDQSIVGLACRERNIKPMLPPELINPTNGEIVETLQPLLLWRGPLPLQSQGVRYSLRLVEQPLGRTDALNAVQTRPPLLNLSQLNGAFLPFPMSAKPLEDGKFYAWQVEAWQGKLSLGVTEAWSFQVNLPKVAAVAPTQENYCWMKEVEDGNHCSPNDSLKIMYDNIENDPFLNFWIVDKNNKTLNFNVPQIALVKGINAIALSLDAIQVTKPKDLFRLYIQDAKGHRSFLSFRRFPK